MKKQVLVLNNPSQFDPADETATNVLQDEVEVTWLQVSTLDAAVLDEIHSKFRTTNILVTSLVEVRRDLLRRLPELEAVIATSTATDYIDLAYCRESNIKVFNTPRYTGSSVAEHAFSLIMACTKHLRRADVWYTP